jgi:hypothetical protein
MVPGRECWMWQRTGTLWHLHGAHNMLHAGCMLVSAGVHSVPHSQCQGPTWLSALKACWLYQVLPSSSCRLRGALLLYAFFRPTLVSFTLGKGMPTTSTPRALPLAKSMPSDACVAHSVCVAW